MAKQLSKKDKMIRGVALALGVGAVATGGYYGYKAVDKAKKEKKALEAARQRDIQAALTASQTAAASAAAAQRAAAAAANRLPAATGFPILRGAQGDMVRQLQEGLAKNYPAAAAILNPVRSQFGTFGPTTERALAAAGFATNAVSEADFKKITGQGGGAGPQVQANAETRQRFGTLATTLRTRFEGKGTLDINAANRDIFNKLANDQDWRDFNSIYNGIYGGDALMADLQKYNNSNIAQLGRFTWHINKLRGALANLSGPGLLGAGHQLYTMMETLVRDESGKVYEVPANSLIGTELASRDGLLVFSDPNGRMGLVDANAVAYL